MTQLQCTAFLGSKCLATGTRFEVASALRNQLWEDPNQTILIFDDKTGHTVDIDFRQSDERFLSIRPESLSALDQQDNSPRKGAGRPKLGVVSREITLLPRHWEWLNQQDGGASVTLRKLVEVASKQNQDEPHSKKHLEKIYRIMSSIAGNEVDFEEATRALFAKDFERLKQKMHAWPKDISNYILRLVPM